MYKVLLPEAYDPVYLRVWLTMLPMAILISSYVKAVQKYMMYFMYFLYTAALTWIIYIIHMNDHEEVYIIGLILLTFGISLGFEKSKHLLIFDSLLLIAITISLLSSEVRSLYYKIFTISSFSTTFLLAYIVIHVKEKFENKIESKNQSLEEINKDITDSINYAKQIQEAILPPLENIKNVFPDSFVLYKPRDIVSGDFYWFSRKNGDAIIAAIDCTGHGVPGAFMSIMGNTLLNQIVNEKGITSPDQILNELTKGISDALSNESKDGMDISICSINLDKMQLIYAGAQNPIYIVQQGEIRVIEADKKSIEVIKDKYPHYSNTPEQIATGDSIYLFSDGYADQFGGPKGKKFTYKRLREILEKNTALPMNEQKEKLNKALMDWMEKEDQVDDILLIGIKI